MGPTAVLLQRVAADAPLHSPTLVTRQGTRRPHVAGAAAAAAVVRVIRTRLRIELPKGHLVVLRMRSGGVLHWRRRGCVLRREKIGEGLGGA